MYKKVTFIDQCLSGDVDIQDIDGFVAKWHSGGDDDGTLSEFLGMTDSEYATWVERPASLPYILAARRHKQPLSLLLKETEEYKLAARSSDAVEAGKILKWLEKTGRV